MKSLLALASAVGLLSSLALSKLVPLEEIRQDAADEEEKWLSHFGKNEATFEYAGQEPTNCTISVSRTEMPLLIFFNLVKKSVICNQLVLMAFRYWVFRIADKTSLCKPVYTFTGFIYKCESHSAAVIGFSRPYKSILKICIF